MPKDISYTLVRSARRKTLGLQVRKGEVIVRAPFFVDEDFIDQFIASKSDWLRAKVSQQLNAYETPKYSIKAQGRFLFLGEEKQVVLRHAGETGVTVDKTSLVVTLPQRLKCESEDLVAAQKRDKKLQLAVGHFYSEYAQEYLAQRLAYWSSKLSLVPSSLVIKKYKARWGSCSASGKVSLNYWLVACPLFVIDYVIVHELCHLVHLNHSSKFWQLVYAYFPEAAAAKSWLKTNQTLLDV